MLYDDKNYKWGIFYYNKEDDRLFANNVRKAGSALNLAHPVSKIFVFVIALVLIGAIILTIIS